MRKRLVQTALGLAVSAVALWLTLRGKDLGAIWEAMKHADYRFVALYFPFWLVIHLARTVRWGILLEPVAKVPFRKLNAASAVGYMALVILPFRLGEFARPYLVAERPNLRVSAALSSIVVERVADGILTAVLLVAALLLLPAGLPGAGLLRTGGFVVGLAFLGLLVFLVVAYRHRVAAVRLAERLLRPVSPRLASRGAGMLDAFIHGLKLVTSPAKLVQFAVLSAIYWGANGWGMQVLARGFGLTLDVTQTITLLGALVIGVMIPAGPGMVGTFQGAVVLGLGLFFPRSVTAVQGVAYANVCWAAQLAFQVAAGIVFLFSRHIQLARILAAPAEVAEGLVEEEAEAVPEATRR